MKRRATCPSIDKRTVNLRVPLELAVLVETHYSSADTPSLSHAYISALESVTDGDKLTREDVELIEAERAANKLRNNRTLKRYRALNAVDIPSPS